MSDTNDTQKPVLVVASKVKAYAKEKGMRCSAEAFDVLTGKIEREVDKAAEAARADNRNTIKGRDFQSTGTSDTQKPVLVVASKVKAYAKEKGMRCSAEAFDVLTTMIEGEVDKAAEAARADNRNTIKGRDFQSA